MGKSAMIKLVSATADVDAPAPGSGSLVQDGNSKLKMSLTHPLTDGPPAFGELSGLTGVEWVEVAGPDPGEAENLTFDGLAALGNALVGSSALTPADAGTTTEHELPVLAGMLGQTHYVFVRWGDE